MRILLFFQWQGGGIPEVFRQLVKAGLSKECDLVQCIAEPVTGDREAYFSEIGEWFDCSVGWLGFMKTLKKQLCLADVVHVNSLKTLLLLLLIGQWKIPTVLQVHGEYDYLKRCSGKDKIKYALLRLAVAIVNVREIVCVNLYISKLLSDLTVPRVIIENGIVAISPQQGSIIPPTPVVLGVGRLDPEKQFDKFIEIARRVNEKLKVEFHIYGNGVLYSELEELILRNRLQKMVRLQGYTRNPLVVMASSDILLCTSSREGSPLTFAEALSVGLPIVTFPVGVARDILGWSPAIYVGKDISQLSNHIIEILSGGKILEKMCKKRCTALFNERFDAKKKVLQYEEVYNRVFS